MISTPTTNELLEDKTPKISELDFCLNSFRQQKVLTDDDAYVQDIRRLITMKPGTFQSDPDMGIGISQYRFADMDLLTAGELSDRIESQIRNYIPQVPLESVNIQMLKIQNGFVLYIDIAVTSAKIRKISYAYLQSNNSIIGSQITIDRPKYINTEGSD